jgi:hypothetical protein
MNQQRGLVKPAHFFTNLKKSRLEESAASPISSFDFLRPGPPPVSCSGAVPWHDSRCDTSPRVLRRRDFLPPAADSSNAFPRAA